MTPTCILPVAGLVLSAQTHHCAQVGSTIIWDVSLDPWVYFVHGILYYTMYYLQKREYEVKFSTGGPYLTKP